MQTAVVDALGTSAAPLLSAMTLLPSGLSWMVVGLLALLCLIADSAPLVLPRGDRISGDGALVIAALLTTGIGGACIVSVVGCVTFCLNDVQERRSPAAVVRDIARRLVLVILSSTSLLAFTALLDGVSREILLSVTSLLAAGIYVLADLAFEGLFAQMRRGAGAWRSGIGVLRSTGSAYMGQAAIAVVVAVLLPPIGVWAVLILGALILTMRQSFASYLEIRRAYHETILALARGAEIGGVSELGRAERLADLSVALGRKLGLREHQLEALNYAALLHDVGRLGDSDEAMANGSHEGVAERSARILEDIESLRETAGIIRRCGDACDQGPITPAVPEWQALAAQVLGAVVDWDSERVGWDYQPSTSVTGDDSNRRAVTLRDPKVAAALDALVRERAS